MSDLKFQENEYILNMKKKKKITKQQNLLALSSKQITAIDNIGVSKSINIHKPKNNFISKQIKLSINKKCYET